MQNLDSSPERRRWQTTALQLAVQDASCDREDSAKPLKRMAEQSTGETPSLSLAQHVLAGKGQLPLLSWHSDDSDTIPAVQGGCGSGEAIGERQAAGSLPVLCQTESETNLPAANAGFNGVDSPRILVTVAHSLPGAPQIKHPKV